MDGERTSSDPPSVQVFALGGFRVVVNGRVVEDHAWRRKTARQLFKALLSRPNRRMMRDEVIDLLWPESDPEAASTNLRSTIHAMRRALDPAEPVTGLSMVFGDRDSVWLRPDVELWVDADAFELTVKHARQSADPLPMLQRASGSYTGDYLPDDLYEDWAIERRDALKQLWTNLQFELAQEHLARGKPDAAVGELQRLLGSDRCDERAAQELMQVLIQLRRRSDALRVYQNLEQALREELGVEPSERTRDLQHQAATPDAPAGSRRAVFRCAYTFPEPKQLIGRETELKRLQTILDRGRTSGQLVLIDAAAGTGKSTLVGALVKVARRSGVLCLAGAAYDERSAIPLAAFQEAFTDYVLAATANPIDARVSAAAVELIEAVRELSQHPAGSGTARVDASAERSRLFAASLALLRAVAELGPVLVCLEDLHIADEATLHLLHYLVRQTRHAPVTFVGTLRSEALQPGQPISQFVAALTREHLVEQVQVPALDHSATDRLVAMLVDAPVSSSLSASVYASTDGNPLFVEQLILALRDEGRLNRTDSLSRQVVVADLSTVPVVVRELISERLARLTPRSRQTLETAAVLGHTFDYADLLAVVEPDDEATLLTDLDEAIRAQLLRERPNGFAFSHSLMRDGVYWGLSRPRRMLLHGRAGEVLERRAENTAFNLAAELAYHFGLAGFAAPIQSKAIQYSLRAGQQAAALAANREALRHFQLACTLIERGARDVDVAKRIVALEGRGLAERGMGMWHACIKTFHQVLEYAAAPTERARARESLSFALHHLGNTRGALGEAEMGLAELGDRPESPDADIVRIQLQHQLAVLLFLQGRFGDLLRLGPAMVTLAERIDQPRWLAWAQAVVGWAHAGSGRSELALPQYELVVAHNEASGDQLNIASAHTNLGMELYRARRFVDAQVHLEKAVALYREAFSDLRAVLALQGLGWVHLAQGNVGRAQEYADVSGNLASEAHDRWLAECLELAGALQALRAEWEAAEGSLTQGLEIGQRAGNVTATIDALVRLGRVHESRGAFTQALDRFQQAVALADSIDPAPCVVAAHRCLGSLLVHTGAVEDGAGHVRHALTLAEQIPESLEYAPTLLARARLQRLSGDSAGALATAAQVVGIAHTAEFAVEARVAYAELLLAEGRAGEAEALVHAAILVAEGLGAPVLLGAAYRCAAAVATALDNRTAAAGFQRAAARQIQDVHAPNAVSLSPSGQSPHNR
jgi:DNA-binding SARP family transcriptional activator/tetratricopeptide (TPR) repeat protein